MVSRTCFPGRGFRPDDAPRARPHRFRHLHFVTYDDLHIDVQGPEGAPPILILHGWGSSAQGMAPLTRSLSKTYRTHAFDLPGHGQSPPPPEPWGVPEHAELLLNYIDREINTKVALVGHSNGGRIGLYMASTPPMHHRIDQVVLISPSGMAPDRSWQTRFKATLANALKTPVQALPEPLRSPAEDWLRHTVLWKALGSSDYNALSGVMRETFVKTVNHTLDGPVHRIDVPTLVFWGTEDTAVSRSQMKRLEDAITDCAVIELPGAGHYGHLDDPDTVIAATHYFLEHG